MRVVGERQLAHQNLLLAALLPAINAVEIARRLLVSQRERVSRPSQHYSVASDARVEVLRRWESRHQWYLHLIGKSRAASVRVADFDRISHEAERIVAFEFTGQYVGVRCRNFSACGFADLRHVLGRSGFSCRRGARRENIFESSTDKCRT